MDEKFHNVMQCEKVSQMVYANNSPRSSTIEKKEEQWCSELLCEVKLKHQINRMRRITVVPKFQSFQYRMLMRSVITNVQLNRWGIVPTDQCSLCEKACETIEHLFFQCEAVKPLIKCCSDIIVEITGKVPEIVYPTVVLCETNTGSVGDFIVLVMKQYIYRKRCLKQPLKNSEFKYEVYRYKAIEKYQAIKTGRYTKFCKKWYEDLSIFASKRVDNLTKEFE